MEHETTCTTATIFKGTWQRKLMRIRIAWCIKTFKNGILKVVVIIK